MTVFFVTLGLWQGRPRWYDTDSYSLETEVLFMLKTRVKTAAVLTVVVLAVLYFSYIPLVWRLFCAFLACVAVWELFAPVRGEKGVWPHAVIGWAAALTLTLVPIGRYALCFALPVFLLGCGVFAWLMARLGTYKLDRPWKMLSLSVITSVFFGALACLRMQPQGLLHVLLCLAVCVSTDTTAYFVGRAGGKRKIAPRISPHKSVAGCVGGLAGCLVLVGLLSWAAGAVTGAAVRWAALLPYLPLASVIAQFGDFSLSAVKRTVGIKDYGNLMPGHGGVLDRFDSLLFVTPFTLLWCTFLGGLFQ